MNRQKTPAMTLASPGSGRDDAYKALHPYVRAACAPAGAAGRGREGLPVGSGRSPRRRGARRVPTSFPHGGADKARSGRATWRRRSRVHPARHRTDPIEHNAPARTGPRGRPRSGPTQRRSRACACGSAPALGHAIRQAQGDRGFGRFRSPRQSQPSSTPRRLDEREDLRRPHRYPKPRRVPVGRARFVATGDDLQGCRALVRVKAAHVGPAPTPVRS